MKKLNILNIALLVLFITSCTTTQNTTNANNDNVYGKTEKCKSFAALKWTMDFSVHHKNLSQEEVLQLAELVGGVNEDILVHCKDGRISYSILKAAKQGIKPKWIKNEINIILTGAQQFF